MMAAFSFLLGAAVSLVAPAYFWTATALSLTYVFVSRYKIWRRPADYAAAFAPLIAFMMQSRFPVQVDRAELETILKDRYPLVALALTPFMLIGAMIGLSLAATVFGTRPYVDPIVDHWNRALLTVAGIDTANVLSLANIAAAAGSNWLSRILNWWLHNHYLYAPWRQKSPFSTLQLFKMIAVILLFAILARIMQLFGYGRRPTNSKTNTADPR
jgi:hypothetical protein